MDTSDYVISMGMVINVARLVIGVNDLFTMNPELAAQWHPTKNGGLTPEDVSQWSHKKIWWTCALAHDWEAVVNNRSNGAGCPTCTGKNVKVGFNDLATIRPELVLEWHPTKNGTLTPRNVTANSGRKAWWICELLHEWEATINDRSNGGGCPTCAGKSVKTGFNDLGTLKPELAVQWHPTKNGTLTPQNVTVNSNRKAWWICEALHEWDAGIGDRSRGSGCPYCSGRLPIAGSTDLATLKPELAVQWHPTRNGTLTPQHVTTWSNRRVAWLCSLSHEWEATINSRSRGNRCPYCFGSRSIVGSTDLGTVNPDLAAQWHPTLNGALTPQDVTVKSGQKAWWLCELLHEWDALISNRSNGSGCPECCVRFAGFTENAFREAFGKFAGFYFYSSVIGLVRFSRRRDRAQIDMLNDDLKLVIEYDGEWTHGKNSPDGKTLERNLANDKETTQALVDIGYNVIRIRENSRDGKLPFIPLDPEYDSSVFQITYKSFSKDKDDIEELAKRIIDEKEDWFKAKDRVLH